MLRHPYILKHIILLLIYILPTNHLTSNNMTQASFVNPSPAEVEAAWRNVLHHQECNPLAQERKLLRREDDELVRMLDEIKQCMDLDKFVRFGEKALESEEHKVQYYTRVIELARHQNIVNADIAARFEADRGREGVCQECLESSYREFRANVDRVNSETEKYFNDLAEREIVSIKDGDTGKNQVLSLMRVCLDTILYMREWEVKQAPALDGQSHFPIGQA
ncbi:hypothetical protein B0F90DRAFT_1920515 [Multifurca ochricompacta]|uniref:Uncharacterized protein n=1 Tax=Multifurca ochricompacta TaxID=376703 RepID=A0AAD4LW20_9AGAM|nr:hypothetical protein B0F90DRAFT_1920515 [Multifurca ochricompacta]